MGKSGSIEIVRNRLESIKSCHGPKGCASCDCYYLLLFYLIEELTNMKGSEAEALFEEISKEFRCRKNLKLHGCQGCVPCHPAEWAAEFAKKKGAK